MAQINVERKRSGAWIWLLVGLILFVIVVWVLIQGVNREDEEPVGPMQTSAVQPVAPVAALLVTAGTPGWSSHAITPAS